MINNLIFRRGCNNNSKTYHLEGGRKMSGREWIDLTKSDSETETETEVDEEIIDLTNDTDECEACQEPSAIECYMCREKCCAECWDRMYLFQVPLRCPFCYSVVQLSDALGPTVRTCAPSHMTVFEFCCNEE